MIDLEPACRRMTDVLAGVTDDRLTHATPCADYTVGDLINHIDEVACGFAALARKEHADADNGADAGPAPLGRGWCEPVTAHVLALGASWADPAAWQGSTEAAGVELPNERWGRVALTEMVVHGWDLAVATGRPFGLPAATLQACLDHVADFVPRAPVPALWGPAADIPDDAPLLDRIIAITGRSPQTPFLGAEGSPPV
ncbi:TIGR03086 family protein [Streptomyces sp. SID10853]|uniref:TIGR03086 family metal-binding protein n=1 Tax=Streptomyces sp. SID10853 TaxID=2706028 RepID=UPI0013C0B5F2|nr:TIGR03086 family metal-binding protein [Streptomyces sp. SID10853]NDZ82525.1 TIGR03086 family protein [Streptomyces sp. SID10853]